MSQTKTQMQDKSQTLTKLISYFMIISFAIFLAGFGILHLLLPDNEFSEDENRFLEQIPEISEFLTDGSLFDGSLTRQIELYLSDQFPFLSGWVSLKSSAVRAIGILENNGVYFAKDDYLIDQFMEVDRRNLQRNISSLAEFSEYTTLPITLCLIPNDVWTLRDKLPMFAPDADQYSLFQSIQSDLYEELDAILYGDEDESEDITEIAENNDNARDRITIAPVFDALYAHKDEPIYYKTDHHYTTLGAYYIYEALMTCLGEKPLRLDEYNQKVVTETFKGTMHSKSGAFSQKPDTIALFEPISRTHEYKVSLLGDETVHEGLYWFQTLNTKDKYNIFLGGNNGLITIVSNTKPYLDESIENNEFNTPEYGKKLLIIKDSFAHCLAPFLTAHYSEITLLDLRYYKLSLLDYLDKESFDEIMLVYNMANFVTDKNIPRINN